MGANQLWLVEYGFVEAPGATHLRQDVLKPQGSILRTVHVQPDSQWHAGVPGAWVGGNFPGH